MKNTAISISILLFSVLQCLGQVPAISSDPLPESEALTAIASRGNLVYVLGRALLWASGGQARPKVILAKFEDGKWQEIPVVINPTDARNILIPSKPEHLLFDRSGLLWITVNTNFMLKYDGNVWHTYKMDDGFTSVREYGSMTCDSAGNIWVMTRISGADAQSALLKFDGTNFEVVQRSASPVAIGGAAGQQIVTRPDGTVVWHYFRTKSTNPDYSDSSRAELFFYRDGHIDSAMAETYDNTPNTKYINAIHADADNSLIFNYSKRKYGVDGKLIIIGGGLSTYNSNGTWKHFTTDQGLPRADRSSTLPTDVYSGARDRNGRWWFGGQGSIFTLNNQRQINVPAWQEIHKGAVIYKQETLPGYQVYNIMKGMWDTTALSGPDFSSVATTYDGNTWYMIGPLILRIASEPTSVNNDKQDRKGINVFPNPVSENVTISFPQNTSLKTTVKLRDITGREMLLKEFPADESSHTFSLKELPVGVYVLEVRSVDEVFEQKVSVVR